MAIIRAIGKVAGIGLDRQYLNHNRRAFINTKDEDRRQSAEIGMVALKYCCRITIITSVQFLCEFLQIWN